MVKAGNDDSHSKDAKAAFTYSRYSTIDKGMKAECDTRHWNAGLVFCKFNRKKRKRV